jgi:hypothetical protein
MKKILLTVFALFSIILVNAQSAPAKDSLDAYLGKYKFPEGSAVTEIGVVIEEGSLIATSAMGNSALKKMEGDVFEVVAYSGVATFKRNEGGKVIGVKIEVGDMILEGTKTEGIHTQELFAKYSGYKSYM